MEASIIFHFASRGVANQRLALIDFAQFLDPRWRAPHEDAEPQGAKASKSLLTSTLLSSYNFVLGGMSRSGFTVLILMILCQVSLVHLVLQ